MLEEITAYEYPRFFGEVAMEIALEKVLLGKTENLDSTSFSLTGDSYWQSYSESAKICFMLYETKSGKKINNNQKLDEQVAALQHELSGETID